MMCIPCAEFQFCIHYIQLAFEKKMANMISKGGEGGTRLSPSLALISEKQHQKVPETTKEDENILKQVLELSNGLQRPHQVGYVSMFGIAMKSCPPPQMKPCNIADRYY